MPEYLFSPAAEQDLAEIWRYSKKQWGKEQANNYIVALRACCV
jgi:toxin ParE1/3/4